VRPERRPAHRDAQAVGLIAHPVDLVDVHPKVGERRQQRAGHLAHVGAAVALAQRAAVPAHVGRVGPVDRAQVATVVGVVEERADEVVDALAGRMALG
jgi:hypothetical protein